MKFTAIIDKIGVNPYVFLPEPVLKKIFVQAGKEKGHIPVSLVINGHAFIQHLVRYSGEWRLYLNTPMRKAAGKEVGDKISIIIQYDPVERSISMHPTLQAALDKNKKAKAVFDQLPPYGKKEIQRYIIALRTDEAVERNVTRAISFLLGKERFIGRDKPIF